MAVQQTLTGEEADAPRGPCPDYSDECGFVVDGRCVVCDYGRDG